jgi:hypothetical protein
MLANNLDVSEWVYGILHGEPVPSGDFLRSLADAVVRADAESYAALVPGVRLIMLRFPKYKCSCQEWASVDKTWRIAELERQAQAAGRPPVSMDRLFHLLEDQDGCQCSACRNRRAHYHHQT